MITKGSAWAMLKNRRATWEKMKWTWRPETNREAGDSVVRNFLLHWFPAKVTRQSLSWNYSFWLGTISAVLFLILIITGIPLMFLYVPSVERAYLSVKDLEFTVSFGWFLRGLHRIAAPPMVGERMRFFLLGGRTIDQNTLIRFYVLHCFFLPLGVLLLFSYHMWRVRKDGGLACVDQLSLEQKKQNVAPTKSKTYSLLGITSGRTVHVETSIVDEDKHTVTSSPNLTRRLLLVTLGTLAVTALLTILFHAPLEAAANPSITPNPAKAPWYFLWLQELVTDTTFTMGGVTINGALLGGIIIPGILVIAAIVWPYLDKSPVRAAGVWMATERRKQNLVFLTVVAAILILTIIGTYLRGPYWNFYWPWQSWPTMPRKF